MSEAKALRIGVLPEGIYSLHDSLMTRGFERDAVLLESALAENPSDPRSIFYLGNTYNMLERKEDAIEQWAMRISLGGWDEEVYMSALYLASVLDVYFRGKVSTAVRSRTWEAMLRPGLVQDKERNPGDDVPISPFDIFTAFKKANELLPYRQEALYHMAKISRADFSDLVACTAFAEAARAQGPYDERTLFADQNVYTYGVLDEICKCAYYVPGKFDIGKQACIDLLAALEQGQNAKRAIPPFLVSMLQQAKYNLNAYTEKKEGSSGNV